LSVSLPPEILQNILQHSTNPVQDAIALSQVVNGPLEYIIQTPEFYHFLTSSLNHFNFKHFPFSPFDFFLPPPKSLAGVYFTCNPLWFTDVNFAQNFTNVFDPVIETTYALLQSKIDQFVFVCTCCGCRHMQLYCL
jgi:hypothetical protein